MHLLLEIAVLHHAGKFDQPAQRNFAPAAAYLRAPQRIDQVLGLLGELLLAQLHRLELHLDAAVGLAAGLLEFGDLLLSLLQRVPDRLDEILDRLFPSAEFAFGLFMLRSEVLLGQPQEILAVGLQ